MTGGKRAITLWLGELSVTKLRSRYHLINSIIFCLLCVFLANRSPQSVLNGLAPRILELSLMQLIAHTTSDLFVYSIFWACFAVLVLLPERTWTRLAQIVAFVVLGSFTILAVAPIELGGDLLFLMAIGLSYRYGFLRKHVLLKVIVFAAVLVLVRIGSAAIYADAPPIRITFTEGRIINQLSIIVVVAAAIFVVFEQELQHANRERKRLEALQDQNVPFIEFAHSTAGIVHDFKNDLGLFHGFGQLLKLSEGDIVSPGLVTQFQGYVQRFDSRVSHIMTVNRASHRVEFEQIELGELIESIAYVFQSSLDYKRIVTITTSIPDEPVVVWTEAAPLTSIVENLVKNACEALVVAAGTANVQPGSHRVDIALSFQDNAEIRVCDNGPGFPFDHHEDEENLLYHRAIAAGQTTKQSGTGIGLVSVRRTSERHGIPVYLESEPGHGVRATIVVPADRRRR